MTVCIAIHAHSYIHTMLYSQVYVAAFAVSGYASFVHRAKYKPFNPILGETYECIREDRGFKYVSEQVSLTVICLMYNNLIYIG